MITKFTSILILFFLVVVPQFSQVNAQSYLIENCGQGPFIPGINILEINGIGGTPLNSGANSHNISIKYDTEGNYPNLYLKISSKGKKTFTTEQITPIRPPNTNYKRFEVNFSLTDSSILKAFSGTDSRDFEVSLHTKRTYFDKMCELGSYTVQKEVLDTNNPDHYCGTTTGSNICTSIDGTQYTSSQFDPCSGASNTNSQYGCCSLDFLAATNNVCPATQISGCGTWDDNRLNCLDNQNRIIRTAQSCTTNENICCSQDKLDTCPQPIQPATCGQILGTSEIGNRMCHIQGVALLQEGRFVTCPTDGECCRKSSQCTEQPDNPTDPNADGDPTNDVVDPPFQGPTVATFNALNPLLTEGSKQAVRLSTPGGIVSRFLVFAFPLAGLILFAMLSWAGFEILTGATNQKSLDAGKQRATAAIVGFLLLFASYWLMQIVEVVFGISIL